MVAYSFKRLFVPAIRIGLGIDPQDPEAGARRPKRQTIRANGLRAHARPGDELQLYCAQRTKHCFLIGRARCVAAKPIRIIFNPVHPIIYVGGSPYRKNLQTFAQDDGFASWRELREFWNENHRGVEEFEGMIIFWKPAP